jgi:prolyl-tRNA synthetase
MGPHGHPEATVVADLGVRGRAGWGAGANLDDHHVRGLVIERDVAVDVWADLVPARDGDPCPACDGGTLRTHRALAVARDGVVDALGVVRATAARTADDRGPVWPVALAPFEVVVVLVTPDDPDAAKAADRLHDDLEAGGAAVYLDDRSERAGVKFADADLLGAPLRATVGSRGVADGVGDLTLRHTGDTAQVALTELAEEILAGLDRLP